MTKKYNDGYRSGTINLTVSILTLVSVVVLILLTQSGAYEVVDQDYAYIDLAINTVLAVVLMIMSIMMIKDSKQTPRKFGRWVCIVVVVIDILMVIGLLINVFVDRRVSSVAYIVMYVLAAVYAIKDFNRKEENPTQTELTQDDQTLNKW